MTGLLGICSSSVGRISTPNSHISAMGLGICTLSLSHRHTHTHTITPFLFHTHTHSLFSCVYVGRMFYTQIFSLVPKRLPHCFEAQGLQYLSPYVFSRISWVLQEPWEVPRMETTFDFSTGSTLGETIKPKIVYLQFCPISLPSSGFLAINSTLTPYRNCETGCFIPSWTLDLRRSSQRQ